MTTTLTFKKKYIYIFFINIFISALLVLLLINIDNKNNKIHKSDCGNSKIKVEYLYNNFWTSKGDSFLNSFVIQKVNNELFNIVKNPDNYEFIDDIIFFYGSLCKENSAALLNIESDINIKIKDTLLDLFEYFKFNKVPLNIKDQHLIYMLSTNQKVLSFSKYEKENNLKNSLNNLIRFLTIFLLLNLLLYIKNSIKIKIL